MQEISKFSTPKAIMNKEPDESTVVQATRSTTLLDRPQHSRSRPTSLVPLAPEKEALIFSVNLTGAPPEVENLIEHIKAVAEQFLYHWKTFPICKIYSLFPHTDALLFEIFNKMLKNRRFQLFQVRCPV